MRPALSEQCLVRGAGNLVPLAAAPERKRVFVAYDFSTTCHFEANFCAVYAHP